MKKIINLTIRNIKVYFSDKGMFFTSLITPAILLVLYSTFLANVYKDAFISAIPDSIEISSKLLNEIIQSTKDKSKNQIKNLCNGIIV